jgi:hypothetical protein
MVEEERDGGRELGRDGWMDVWIEGGMNEMEHEKSFHQNQTPVEAEIRRIVVQSQPWANSS